jgi:CRP-like cAMP-binding protein
LLSKVEQSLALSIEERQSLADLPLQVKTLRADQDVAREGDRPSRCFMLAEGFASSCKASRTGRRQIIGVHVPGDIPDLQGLHLEIMDNSVVTVTPCLVGFIYHDDLRSLCDRHPRLAAAFWRMTLTDAALYREWMVSLGQRSAHARLAHLLCELFTRLEVVGLARDRAYHLPLTQVDLGDMLGLSTVHVNRVMRELRAAGMIALEKRRLTVLDWPGLARAGEFDPAYLHMEMGPMRA